MMTFETLDVISLYVDNCFKSTYKMFISCSRLVILVKSRNCRNIIVDFKLKTTKKTPNDANLF